jgi:hypothetical protein
VGEKLEAIARAMGQEPARGSVTPVTYLSDEPEVEDADDTDR